MYIYYSFCFNCVICTFQPYPEDPAEFKPLTDQELHKIRQDKKQKEVARKQKITDSRKHLANVRVLQKNLVFVVGLSQRLADIEVSKVFVMSVLYKTHYDIFCRF